MEFIKVKDNYLITCITSLKQNYLMWYIKQCTHHASKKKYLTCQSRADELPGGWDNEVLNKRAAWHNVNYRLEASKNSTKINQNDFKLS